jgi:hypothetical protein
MAERKYRAALKADDDNVVALNNLAWLLVQDGRSLDEAEVLIKRALAGNPIQSEPVSMADARGGDLATIQQALELKVVQHRLQALGFTPTEIDVRLALASDAELHQLATHSENVLAGGAVGLLVSVLVVILLVLLILRIASNDSWSTSNLLIA